MNCLKYLFATILFALFALSQNSFASGNNFVVVIDPGHGGHDPGAIGAVGQEKDINLAVALKVGKLINNNSQDTRVIYTRTTDVFIPLDQRAKIANDAHADLFISIHTNSLAKGKTVKGAETYTLGLHRTQENLDVAKKENSVILIEKDYKQRYAGFNPNSSESYIMFEFLQDKNMKSSIKLASLIQQQFKDSAHRIDKGVHQAGFLVLRETSMPSVLVELGYISTPEEESYLLTDEGTTEMATSIYNAFINYKKSAKKGSSGNIIATDSTKENKIISTPQRQNNNTAVISSPIINKNEKNTLNSEDKPVFMIQLLSTATKLADNSKQLKGLTPVDYYQEGGLYKYTYGNDVDYNNILKLKRSISDKFKDSFIIAFKNGNKMNINDAIKEFKQSKR